MYELDAFDVARRKKMKRKERDLKHLRQSREASNRSDVKVLEITHSLLACGD